jgi:hypothetical protein
MGLDACFRSLLFVQVMIAGTGIVYPLVTMDFPLYNVYW